MSKTLLDTYAINTFNDLVMKEKVSKEIYEEFHKALENKETLSKECATAIADAMKEWALEKGALILLIGFRLLLAQQLENTIRF